MCSCENYLARTGKTLKTKILRHLETNGNNICTFILPSIEYYKTNLFFDRKF